jgi:hypothetical protein
MRLMLEQAVPVPVLKYSTSFEIGIISETTIKQLKKNKQKPHSGVN